MRARWVRHGHAAGVRLAVRLSTLAGVLTVAALLAVAMTAAQEAGPPDEPRVVRAYFDDPSVAYRAVISLEALEWEYEKGYIVVLATDRDIEAMRAAGMRIVPDDSRLAAYDPVAGAADRPAPVNTATIPSYSCYRTVEETYAGAQAIVDAYPDLATWSDVGDSWKKEQDADEGHDIYVLRLTNSATSGEKPDLFITTAIHAREYTTAEFGMRFAEYMAENYETDADIRWLLDHHELHMMLQANPDGRKRAEGGLWWRKNHNTDHCSSGSWAGVDLNRNFNFKWGPDYPGSSGSECSQTYRGSAGESEPETKAVAGYMRGLWTDARGPDDDDAAAADTSGLYMDIHSYSELILWPWGHTSEAAPNGTALQTLGRKLAYDNGYVPHTIRGLYAVNGSTSAYAYGELGRAAIAYELGTSFFQSCGSFRSDVLEQNRRSVLYGFKVARAPYVLPKGPDAIDVSLSGTASTTGVSAGTEVTLSATLDDTRYGTRNGSEATQNIAAGEYYADTPPWQAGATAVAMSASDGTFDAKSEAVTATVDTTGWSAGRHTLFVRGKDADDNWGPVSAVFLFVGEAPPSQPAAPRLASAPGQLTVGWTAPAANESAITGYRVRYKRADRDFGWQVEDAGTALELVLSDKYSNRRLDVQVRAVNGVGGGVWSASSTGQPRNQPATGAPAIEGQPLVGSTLTAVTTGIADPDGLSEGSFRYQWVRRTGGTDSDIANATGSTYVAQPRDRGSTLKVNVAFTDDAGNEEAPAGTDGVVIGALTAAVDRLSAAESAGTVTVRIDTGGATLRSDEIVELVLGGTATRGTDYEISAERLTVSAGASSATAVVTLLDDAVDEGDETIEIAARHGDGNLVWSGPGITGPVVVVALRLVDDDTRGLSVSDATLPVTEGGSADYRVALTSEPTGSVTVTPSVPPGTDVSVRPSSLTFTSSDWNVSQPVTVEAAEDSDGASDAPVTVSHAVGGGDYGSVRADSVVVTIVENDVSALSTVDGSAPESGGEMAFEVTISVAGTADVTVDYATSDGTARAGSDYTATSGTLTFPQGSASSQSIRVPVLDDGADEEEEETFRLTLSNVQNGVLAGAGSTLRVTGTIEDDDDPAVTVSFGRSRYDVAEGRSVDVAVRLDKDPERTLSVPLEATHLDGASPADYAGVPLETTFGPGQRSAAFLFSATDDSEVDAGESVELQFGSLLPSGVTAGPAAVVAIRDNDGGGRGPGGDDPGGGPGGRRPPRPPNRPPEAVGTLADQALTVGADAVQVDVAAAFRDPDRDALEYAAESSAEGVAAAAVDGSVVTVTPVGAGTAAVTVTASDGEAGNAPAEQAFTVTVVVDYDSDADGLIEVRTPAQLDAVRHDLDGDGAPAEAGAEAHAAAFAGAVGGVSCAGAGGCRGYELLADLDLDTNGSGGPDAGDAYWNDGSGWLPIGTGAEPFAAAFEGNGQVIRRLFVARGAGGAGAGLFGATAPSSVVARVGLVAADVTGTNGVGVLAGRNGGRVTASWAAGRVSGTEAVGGLLGSNAGNVGGSYAAVAVSGGRQAGGLVGLNEGGLAAVYATGRVSGTAAVGGLVGHHRGTLTAGYATGRVRATDAAGGLVGTVSEPGTAEAPATVTASYWDTQTSGAASSAAGRGLTTSALQRPTAYGGLYAGWNVDADGDGILDGPWHLGTAAQYPALALDVDGDGRASWPELGRQLRAGPAVTAAPAENLAAENLAEVALAWTAADTSAWTPAPEVTYTVTREAGATVPTGATLETGARVATVAAGVRGTRYVDTDVQPGSAYSYQVAAVVDAGEAARSAPVRAEVPCAYAVTPPHRDVLWAAGADQVAVTTGPGCAWTAASESALLAVASGATGTGPGTVRYTVAANAGGPRRGALVVAGRRVTVYQASPTAFTDHPIERGVTPVRAIHFLELRARIDALRAGAGRPAFPWTDPVLTPGVTRIRRVHLTELRAALGEAYSASGRAAPVYTDPVVTAGATGIRATHLMELRSAVTALE